MQKNKCQVKQWLEKTKSGEKNSKAPGFSGLEPVPLSFPLQQRTVLLAREAAPTWTLQRSARVSSMDHNTPDAVLHPADTEPVPTDFRTVLHPPPPPVGSSAVTLCPVDGHGGNPPPCIRQTAESSRHSGPDEWSRGTSPAATPRAAFAGHFFFFWKNSKRSKWSFPNRFRGDR